MSSRLDCIQNWLILAQESNWSVAALAKRTGVSVRVLERYFLQNVGTPPKAWLAKQRQKRAMELLREGDSVKEIAAKLSYSYANNFSREFKAYWGFLPSTQTGSNKRNGNCRVSI